MSVYYCYSCNNYCDDDENPCYEYTDLELICEDCNNEKEDLND